MRVLPAVSTFSVRSLRARTANQRLRRSRCRRRADRAMHWQRRCLRSQPVRRLHPQFQRCRTTTKRERMHRTGRKRARRPWNIRPEKTAQEQLGFSLGKMMRHSCASSYIPDQARDSNVIASAAQFRCHSRHIIELRRPARSAPSPPGSAALPKCRARSGRERGGQGHADAPQTLGYQLRYNLRDLHCFRNIGGPRSAPSSPIVLGPVLAAVNASAAVAAGELRKSRFRLFKLEVTIVSTATVIDDDHPA